MCSGRDTYDIVAYEKEQEQKKSISIQKSINIQPSTLIHWMAESEPCLFANKSEPAFTPIEKPFDVSNLKYIPLPLKEVAVKMMAIARWHAQLQVSFDRILLRELKAEMV